jgi:hypothetical protein
MHSLKMLLFYLFPLAIIIFRKLTETILKWIKTDIVVGRSHVEGDKMNIVRTSPFKLCRYVGEKL